MSTLTLAIDTATRFLFFTGKVEMVTYYYTLVCGCGIKT
jgi:hypothetical protein